MTESHWKIVGGPMAQDVRVLYDGAEVRDVARVDLSVDASGGLVRAALHVLLVDVDVYVRPDGVDVTATDVRAEPDGEAADERYRAFYEAAQRMAAAAGPVARQAALHLPPPA